jgi:hypothetical protein
VSRRTITDVLRRDCGFGLDVPEGNGWLRMPCPYCGRSGGVANQGAKRSPAAVNHGIGWFVCHACGVRCSASYDPSVASRFVAVLRQAAWAAWRQFPGVLTLDEARSYANERLAVYAGPDDGSCAEAGALERWEKKAQSESELDRFVLHALNCDLLDYARKLIRAADRETPAGDGRSEALAEDASGEATGHEDYLARLLGTKTWEDFRYIEDAGYLDGFPLLRAWKLDGMTLAEIAETLGWTEYQLRQRLEQEKRELAARFYGTSQI